MSKRLNVLDLFCGCGGLSLGFEMAGFDVTLAIDNWEDALVTYRRNHHGTITVNEDLLHLNPSEIAQRYNIHDVDVIIGGPPCQGFSVAGKRIIDDDRNKLYKSFVRFVEHFQPQAFVMENVPNILSIGGGVIRDAIIHDFLQLGYTISYKILTASDYGVPQNRRRAIFVGVRGGFTFTFPKRSVEHLVTTSEALSDLPDSSIEDGKAYPSAPLSEFQKQMREGAFALYNHQITLHTAETQRIIAMVPDGGNYKCLPNEMWDIRKVHIAWTRMNSQKPCFTIDTGHNHHFHYKYNRVPTVRESARIQSFPDTFIFMGGKGSQLRQVGNAVPPLMAKAIAEQLAKIITPNSKMTTYIPEHQYRCTIIRGKSQNDMEDLLPLYADIVHRNCPCTKDEFVDRARKRLSMSLLKTTAYDLLSDANQKTVDNHLTEIAGTLLGLYYYEYDHEVNTEIVYETEACRFLVDKGDYPTFFKNLCLNFQFPNAAKWKKFVSEDMENGLCIKPFCYVIALLHYAQQQPAKELLTKQEIGYYVLNNLDVLQGQVSPDIVYDRIMADRKAHVKRERLRGSKDWQHIKEQFNLLELANLIEADATYLWLNKNEAVAIQIFIEHLKAAMFDVYAHSASMQTPDGWHSFVSDWRQYYGKFNRELEEMRTQFKPHTVILDYADQKAHAGAIKSSVDLGDDGETLVFRLEQERVGNYRKRLINKVLLLGKTKGLGYDISSIEADENPKEPEFARYIEVKTTKRVTEPSFNDEWLDSLNLTAKEWVAAKQYGEYYNIYRVYFTKKKTIIVRIQNPYKKFMDNEIEVYPTIYQMNFGANVTEKRYEGE